MTKAIFLALTMLFGLSLGATTEPTHGGEVDLAASTVNWEGKKVLSAHSGTISLKSAALKFSNHKLTGGNFVIDMSSMVCTDMPGQKGQKLVGHLGSPDFFDVENHTTSELNITNATSTGGDNYTIMGDLTIKGITKPVKFDAVVTSNSATADIKVDRTIYDIKYGSGSFFDNLGNKAIDNEFILSVNLVIK